MDLVELAEQFDMLKDDVSEHLEKLKDVTVDMQMDIEENRKEIKAIKEQIQVSSNGVDGECVRKVGAYRDATSERKKEVQEFVGELSEEEVVVLKNLLANKNRKKPTALGADDAVEGGGIYGQGVIAVNKEQERRERIDGLARSALSMAREGVKPTEGFWNLLEKALHPVSIRPTLSDLEKCDAGKRVETPLLYLLHTLGLELRNRGLEDDSTAVKTVHEWWEGIGEEARARKKLKEYE